MSRREKRILKAWTVLIVLITIVISLATAILLQNIWAILISIGVIVIDFYWLSFMYYQKKPRPRYPLVPPEGKGDVYLPRTDIPRPIYADFREMREKKRKLEKIKKLKHKKK